MNSSKQLLQGNARPGLVRSGPDCCDAAEKLFDQFVALRRGKNIGPDAVAALARSDLRYLGRGEIHGVVIELAVGVIEGAADSVASLLKLWSGGRSDQAGRRKGFVLFGYALRLRPDNLTVAVWDRERTFFSVTVKDRLARAGNLRIVDVDSEETIREWLRTGTARLGLVIPAGFSQRLVDGQQTAFQLLVDGSMPTLAQAGLFGASVLTGEDAAEELTFDDPDHPALPTRKPPIKIEEEILYNRELRDSDFFLPGTIGIVIMLVTLTLSAGLVREKEQQTIEQLLATPISRASADRCRRR